MWQKNGETDPDDALYEQENSPYALCDPALDLSTLGVDLPDSRGRNRMRALSSFFSRHYKSKISIPEGMTRKELGVRKFTAQFLVRYGRYFWDALWDRVCNDAQFQFLKKSQVGFINHTVLNRLCRGYMRVIKPFADRPRKSDTARMEVVVEGFFAALDAFKKKQEEDEEDVVMEELVTDRRDFVVSYEYFVDIESRELGSRPDPCLDPNTFRVGIPQGMMCKELGIIKLTAQFAARYGSKFHDALWERVCTEAEFQFLNKNNHGNDRYTLFSQLHVAYGTIITTRCISDLEAAVEGFLAALDAFKKKQEEDVVVEKLVTDRGDFVVSDEYFLDIEFSPPPETPPQRIIPWVHDMGCDFATLPPHMRYLFATHAGSSPQPLLEEPKPKRHKESDLTCKLQYLRRRNS